MFSHSPSCLCILTAAELVVSFLFNFLSTGESLSPQDQCKTHLEASASQGKGIEVIMKMVLIVHATAL